MTARGGGGGPPTSWARSGAPPDEHVADEDLDLEDDPAGSEAPPPDEPYPPHPAAGRTRRGRRGVLEETPEFLEEAPSTSGSGSSRSRRATSTWITERPDGRLSAAHGLRREERRRGSGRAAGAKGRRGRGCRGPLDERPRGLSLSRGLDYEM